MRAQLSVSLLILLVAACDSSTTKPGDLFTPAQLQLTLYHPGRIHPEHDSLVVSEYVIIQPWLRNAAGDSTGTINVSEAEWSISDTTIAAFASVGILGKRPGTVTVTAKWHDLTAVQSLIVLPGNLHAVSINASTPALLAGDTMHLKAVAQIGDNEDGGDLTIVGVPARWSTSDASVLAVDSTGLIRALRSGSAEITAVVDAITAHVTIAVVQPTGPCVSAGTNHNSQSITSPTTWRKADSPHHIKGTIGVRDSLVIEAGAVVCAAPGAVIEIAAVSPLGGVLNAVGTDAQPILLTSEAPTGLWGGIIADEHLAPPSQVFSHISHATIEYATAGVNARALINIDYTHFRQITGTAVDLSWYGGTIAHSVMDTVGVGVRILGGTFEDNVIRAASDVGLSVGSSSLPGQVKLLGGRIENSGSFGITAGGYRSAPVVEGRPIRVVGGHTIPAVLDISVLMKLYPTLADQDSLLGNSSDVLYVRAGGSFVGDVVVRESLPWRVLPLDLIPFELNEGLVLRMEPGSTITLDQKLFAGRARILAEGTAAKPVTIAGSAIQMVDQVVDSTIISNAVIRGTRIEVSGSRPLLLQNITASDGASFNVSSPNARIVDATITGGGSAATAGTPAVAALVLGANGVTVTNCTVTGSASDGIFVSAGSSIQIHQCNLFSNAGLGVNNQGTAQVDATSNWWGDPAGPNGPNGDGVSTNVLFEPYLMAPR